MRKSHFSVAVASALLFATASSPAAWAQVAPAAQQLAPTREEIDRRPAQQAPRSARLTVDGDIERAPCALDAPAYADIRVTITGAEFNNLQGMTPDELRPAYAGLLGADRPISAICSIRDAAATALRRKGYLAAVQVPVQKIENGVVRFEVLFAKVVAIRVRGNAGKAEKLLAGYLSHLTGEKVFNRYVAERYLLLARDVPGFEVRLALKPAGTVPGELVGEVSVIHTPLELDYSAQNFAAHSTGRWSGALRAQAYGLLGGDRLTASVSSTAEFKEQQIAQLGYDMKLGSDGLTIGGNLTYVWTKPDVQALPLTARTLFATGEISYPVIRSQALSVVGSVGMDYLNQTVKFGGVDLNRDRLRVGFVRLDFDAADLAERRMPNWRASGSIEFRQGFDVFDATQPVPNPIPNPATFVGPSRLYGDPTSTLVRASAAIEVNLGKGLWFAMLPRAQYAFTPLLGFEQYSAGNFSIGRGYDPGTITGDSGIGSAFELRLGRYAPVRKVNFSVQPFVFTDIASTWTRKAGPLPADSDSVISVGGGLRALLNNRFRVDGTLAVPLRAAGLQTHRHDPRLLISLTTKLLPWSVR